MAEDKEKTIEITRLKVPAFEVKRVLRTETKDEERPLTFRMMQVSEIKGPNQFVVGGGLDGTYVEVPKLTNDDEIEVLYTTLHSAKFHE